MDSGLKTDDAPVDRASRTNEPIGRLTPYGSTVADIVAVVQLLQQAWTGALIVASIAGGLAITHLVRYRHRALGWSGLGVVLVTAISCTLVGVSATMLVNKTPSAPSDTATPTTTTTTTNTVTVTSPATSSSPSSPNPTTSTPISVTSPLQPYVDKELEIPSPDSYVEIDFDKPVVSTSSLATGVDLEYSIYSGLQLANQVQIGTGPAERPSDPNVCVDSAQTRPIEDPTEPETIETGMAFCVITDEGNIIWFTVTDKSQDKYSPGFTFRATIWSR